MDAKKDSVLSREFRVEKKKFLLTSITKSRLIKYFLDRTSSVDG